MAVQSTIMEFSDFAVPIHILSVRISLSIHQITSVCRVFGAEKDNFGTIANYVRNLKVMVHRLHTPSITLVTLPSAP